MIEASKNNNLEMVELFLKYDPNTNLEGKDGLTPLHFGNTKYRTPH